MPDAGEKLLLPHNSRLLRKFLQMNDTLKDIFRRKNRVVIVGIGNVMKSDDGFGVALVENLKDENGIFCINAGMSPENYTAEIVGKNPDVILLVDTIHIGCNPGGYEILTPEGIIKTGFTTHDMSLRMFIEYLQRRTKAEVYMLGVQPKDVSFGNNMSFEVVRTLKRISKMIVEDWHARNSPDSANN